MTDIVERLRVPVKYHAETTAERLEAAGEIERLQGLQQEIKKLSEEIERLWGEKSKDRDEIERLRADNSQLAAGGISRTTVYTIMYEENKQLRDEIERLRMAVRDQAGVELSEENDRLIDEIERLRLQCSQWEITVNQKDAELERLRAVLKDCADDLESQLKGYYLNTLDYPSQQRKFERDMEPVVTARELLDGEADYSPVEGAPPPFKPPGTTKRK